MQNEECRVQNRLHARNRAVWQPRAILHSAFYTLHLEWWEVLVMLQSSLPTVVCDTGVTDRQPEHLPLKKLIVEG